MSEELEALELCQDGTLEGEEWKLSVQELGMRKTLSVVRLRLHVEGSLSLDQWKKVKPVISEQLKAYQKLHKARVRGVLKDIEKGMVARMVVVVVEKGIREHRNHVRRQRLRKEAMGAHRLLFVQRKFAMVRDCACPGCSGSVCYHFGDRENRRARAQLRKVSALRRLEEAPRIHV